MSGPTSDLTPFDLDGELPTGTTLLEASAGTGKTYAVGALVARYVAEGHARLEEMLVITFGRAASQELRERVREQLVEAERALADPVAARGGSGLVALLADVDDEQVALRRDRLREALADFDAATIATTHQFCQSVLRSLGVAGDTDSGAELVEDLDELVVEVVDDVYLRRYGQLVKAPFDRATALTVARAAVGDPQARLAPAAAEVGSPPHERHAFADTVCREVERRKRRLGLLSYDDLLSRLADALEREDSPARQRMRQTWRIVLVDEFQDTDPVQWKVLDRAFSGAATMVLIGDPKQAIYAFRGGDVPTYLAAADTATARHTLATNWRSDRPLVTALDTLLGGAALGDPRIVVRPVAAQHPGSRLEGLPAPHPLRLRLVQAAEQLPVDVARTRIAEDLADEVVRLLSCDATFEGRPLEAGDVAVLVFRRADVANFQRALGARGIPSVFSGDTSVLLTQAGRHWLTLLEALEQPHRSARVRAVALTPFVGLSAAELDAGGDDLTDDVGERVRRWLDMLRARGIAAVHEAVTSDGLAARVLATPDGERLLTDLDHLGEVLHEVQHRDSLGLPGLLEWLRSERRDARSGTERTRRLDTDAHAVQLVTIHASKGLQYPVVLLPLLFNKWIPEEKIPLFHDTDGHRTIDVGGAADGATLRRAREEAAGEELRLTYVALTRAQSQVVVWWAPTRDSVHSGLSRLVFGRSEALDGSSQTPDVLPSVPSSFEAVTALTEWQSRGALSLEVSDVVGEGPLPLPGDVPRLATRAFTRSVDTEWRRTSYSGLIRAEEGAAAGVESEPEVEGTVDEDDSDDELTPEAPAADAVEATPSPMASMPSGAAFGSLVHGVLEHADPQAPDLLAELTRCVQEESRWWSVEVPAADLAAALVPMQHTSLGPLAGGRTLASISLRDRLCELDFEFPLAGGEHPTAEVVLAAMADVLRRHLPASDPMRAYADRLVSPALGGQELRGYLSGSIDVVLRVGEGEDQRFVVVDYKTNRLGEVDQPLTARDYTPAAMTAAMLHSHYPLQALLYSVVVHRYLRWRLGRGYDPDRHLGGVLYLYVRGMCGPETPEVDGVPCGVFTWKPPTAMVLELSELLDGRPVGVGAP